jgi:Predicted phosphatases
VLAAALFDFDGTLVDTTEMIFQSMRHATSSVLGRDDLAREELLANVGQPLPRQMEILDADEGRTPPRRPTAPTTRSTTTPL